MWEILLVEDDISLSKTIKLIIEIEWHNVHLTNSLSWAIKIMSNKTFEILVTDTELFWTHKNLDWIKVAEEFKKHNPKWKIIWMSAIDRPEWKWNCDIFLLKSWIWNKLINFLNKL